MRKSITTAALAAVGSLALVGSASAAENWAGHASAQQSIVTLGSASGGKMAGGKPGTINAYLSTRDPDSPKPASQSQ